MNEFRMIYEDGRLYALVEINGEVHVKDVTKYFESMNPLYEWLEDKGKGK